jgi:hypothetical protein
VSEVLTSSSKEMLPEVEPGSVKKHFMCKTLLIEKVTDIWYLSLTDICVGLLLNVG